MHVIAEFTVIPIGTGVDLKEYVKACEVILQDDNIKHELHANGTNVEGEWNEVLEAIRKCHEKLHEMGVPRIATIIKVGTRTDKKQSMEDKVNSVKNVPD